MSADTSKKVSNRCGSGLGLLSIRSVFGRLVDTTGKSVLLKTMLLWITIVLSSILREVVISFLYIDHV